MRTYSVDEPGAVIGSQDHACVEAQRRIEKGLYDHTVSIYKDAGRGVVLGNSCWPGPAQLFLQNLAHNSHTELPKRPAKPHFLTDC
jgi:hypothetical protein